MSFCEPFLGKMDRALCVWLDDEAEKGLSVSGAMIEALIQMLRSDCGKGKGSNRVSSVWFQNCKKQLEPVHCEDNGRISSC